MITNRFVSLSLCIMLLGLAVSAGCATGGLRNNTVNVVLVGGSHASIHGQQFMIDRLPKKLKSVGAKSDTKIVVTIPSGTPLQAVANITAQLRANGFGLVHFERPRSTEIYVEPPVNHSRPR